MVVRVCILEISEFLLALSGHAKHVVARAALACFKCPHLTEHACGLELPGSPCTSARISRHAMAVWRLVKSNGKVSA